MFYTLSLFFSNCLENPVCIFLPVAHLSLFQVISYIYLSLSNLKAQSCLTLTDPMDCNLPGSSVHEILQARIREWVVVPFSRGSSLSRDRTQVSHITGRFFTIWATSECLCVQALRKGWKSSFMELTLCEKPFFCFSVPVPPPVSSLVSIQPYH